MKAATNATYGMVGRAIAGKIAVLIVASVGMVNFSVGLFLSFRSSLSFGFMLPYAILFILFFISGVLVVLDKTKRGAVVVVVALLFSLVLFWYDFSHDRYQLVGGGVGPVFYMWPLYYDPFWRGYKPGNV